jgi:hypothetical protein
MNKYPALIAGQQLMLDGLVAACLPNFLQQTNLVVFTIDISNARHNI